MGDHSVCVYAICKNEAQFAARWFDSMKEADRVVVLDTGSTDNSPELLEALGAEVYRQEISPWRFDTARNRSLDLVPEDTDICVCTDLDEVFQPGWRDKLEKAWRPGCKQARYHYVWSFTPQGRDGVVFYGEKIHSRHGWRWTHPVHEVLHWEGEGAPALPVTVKGMRLEHRADHTKSRRQYLPLLELSVREAPEDDRNAYYLGREYLFYGRWDDCIRTLQHHLAMPTATWRDERSASMRCIAKACMGKGDNSAAKGWYLRAIAEAPHMREPYMDMASLLYGEKDWDAVAYFTACALKIGQRSESYICEAEAWGSLPWDLRAMALYETGRIREALGAAEAALALEPEEPRLQKNVEILKRLVQKEN